MVDFLKGTWDNFEKTQQQNTERWKKIESLLLNLKNKTDLTENEKSMYEVMSLLYEQFKPIYNYEDIMKDIAKIIKP